MTAAFDLVEYWGYFPAALETRYGLRFEKEFRTIGEQFKRIELGERELTVDDVMSIFDAGLPYVNDWTKPDRAELDRKMNRRPKPAAMLIDELRYAAYDEGLIKDLVECFRELTLVALVLHHVYPDRFAICSHHLASLLNVSGETVPKYYLAYCEELHEWAQRRWPTPGALTVVEAEFALWTWYRLAVSQETVHREHRNRFYNDPWVRRRRARGIKKLLGSKERVVLASALVGADPTVAAFTALREFEVALRTYIGDRVGSQAKMPDRVYALRPGELPPGVDYEDLERLVKERNRIAHEDPPVSPDEAIRIIDEVSPIVRHFRPR